MNIKILRGTIVNGKPAFPNDVIEVNAATGAMLVRSGKAALIDKAVTVEEALTPSNNVAPDTGTMGESETGEMASLPIDNDLETDLNDPILNPAGGLTIKSAKPITRAEKR